MKKIAVLTSGGDSSGMNSCIDVLFRLCQKHSYELYGVLNGFQGLIDNSYVLLNKIDVRNIFSVGGSIIKTSRCNEFMKVSGKKKAAKNLIDNKFDYLIVIGGNGSIKGANELKNYYSNIICIPGTIDNDLGYTNQTLGFDTAVNNAVEAIVKMKQTMECNDRGLIVETMGRHCSDIAIYSAVATKADLLITQKLTKQEIFKKVDNILLNITKSPLIIVKENLIDINDLANFLEKKTGTTFKCDILGYIQRGGEPTVSDKIFATELAYCAIDLIKKNVVGKALGICDGKMISVDLDVASKSSEKQENKQLSDIYFDIIK